ncbi:helix-turn-helix domain-containing protein [Segatella copri]|uniref:helix-turn-helix domain-containing protein n=1 Tax=Segatella copri TaxID=165179 RepID=UPI0025883D26|nr:helix-turn-helix domain-containing protein [Segatella copri]WOG31561.1 helix-turn-helix domain-containing protein [Segatella copri]
MEVITMESAAFKKLTEQIAEVAELVGFIASNAIENTQRRKMEPVLTNDDVTKMLGISKRTLQRLRSTNCIQYIMVRGQCRYNIHTIQKLLEERTITKET